jgi:hypothetical protein
MLELLKPIWIPYNKVRLGPEEDGGYVCNEIAIKDSSCLFTYGVGHDIRYEEDYRNKYNKPVYLFDHTIGHEDGWDIGHNLNFYNYGLGFKENCRCFTYHYDMLASNISNGFVLRDKKVLLKIDIEGDEYDYFEKADIEKISEVCTAILLELHWVSDFGYQKRAENILKELDKYFTITHTHGNAWGALFDYKGYKFPETFELTLLNNQYFTSKNRIIDRADYPIPGLDFSNRPGWPDVDLSPLKEI